MTGVWVLCAVLALLLAGWLLRLTQGRWLAPGPLFALYWAAAIGAPAVLAPAYTESAGAVWYIVVLVAAFGFGSVIASGIRPPSRHAHAAPRPVRGGLLRLVCLLGTLTGFAAGALIEHANGYGFSSALSLQSLFEVSSQISEARYTQQFTVPSSVAVLLAVTYAAALISPFAARGAGRLRGALCVAGPALGSTFYAMVTTQRAGMLTTVFLLVAGWICSRLYFAGETPRVGLARFVAAAAAGVALLAAFLGIALLRTGSSTPHMVTLVRKNLSIYLFGYMPGFSHWFTTGGIPTWPRTWGSATFAGIASYLGGDPQYHSALNDWAPLGDGSTTNIFTAWRYLATDFGWALTPLAAGLIGYLCTLAWRRLIQQPTIPAVLASLAGYAWMLHTVTLSIFTFTSVAIALAVAGLALAARPAEPSAEPGLTRHELAVRAVSR